MRIDTIVVSEPGGANPRRVDVAGVQASWELSGVGSFSCFTTIDLLRSAGLHTSVKGFWLTWEHPLAGSWGGLLTGKPTSDDVAEMTAEGWAGLLRGRVLGELDTYRRGQPVGIAQRIVRDAARFGPVSLTLGRYDGGGIPIIGDFGGQDVLDDILPEIAENGPMEWLVTADRAFQAGRHLGEDRSAYVRLVEGRDFVNPRLADDLWADQAAEVLAPITRLDETLSVATTPVVVRKRRRRGGRKERWRPGRRMTSLMDTTIVTVTETNTGGWTYAIPGVGAFSLAVPPSPTRPLPSIPLEIEASPTAAAEYRCGLGDTVYVVIGSVGFAGWFRIINRAYDSASGSIRLAGEALSRDWQANV